MSGTNHIAGGLVFTGIFASLYNINILARWEYVVLTVFFSLLPDIDHTKSTIGKVFYPLAKFLDRHYGHRTITHSLLFYIILFLFFSGVDNLIFGGFYHLSVIFGYSFASHLIFDMVTKQGIPLFYPFKKNACVLPANPEIRFKSSDLRTESVIFVVFCCLSFFCYPLAVDGFWVSYNKKFADTKHLFTSYEQEKSTLWVSGTKENKPFTGLTIKFTSSNELALIDTTGSVFFLKKSDKIDFLEWKKSDKKINFHSIKIEKATPFQIEEIIKDVNVYVLNLYSNKNFNLILEQKFTPSAGKIECSFCQDFNILEIEEKKDLAVFHQLEKANFELLKEKNTKKDNEIALQELSDRLQHLKENIKTFSLYDQQRAIEVEIPALTGKIAQLKEKDNTEKIEALQLDISILKKKIPQSEPLLFSGTIEHFTVSK